MNLKPNLWTVLFLLTAGWLFYTSMSDKESAIDKSVPIDPPTSQIDADTARARIEGYQNSIYPHLSNDTLLKKLNLIAFPKYFKIAPHELQEIVDSHTRWDSLHVYALLSLMPSEKGSTDTIDLIFSYVEKDTRSWQEGTFYDFSKPCPPLCNE